MIIFVTDVETLAFRDDAVILSAGITYVDLSKDANISYKELVDRSLFIKFNASEQRTTWSRKVLQGTVQWWHDQCDEAKQRNLYPSHDDLNLKEGLDSLSKYVYNVQGNKDDKYIASRGIDFDIGKLESAYDQVNMYAPWKYNKKVDIRTAIMFLGQDPLNCGDGEKLFPGEFIKHHPTHDAAMDAYRLINCINGLEL